MKAFPDADICVGIIWIRINPADDIETAQGKTHQFQDTRVTQFYDPNRLSGKAIIQNLPLRASVAWDIYLFYSPGITWNDRAPIPTAWMHQLSDTDADSPNHYAGDELENELALVMKHLGY